MRHRTTAVLVGVAAALAAVTLPAGPAGAQVDPDAVAPTTHTVSCGDGTFVKMLTPGAGFNAMTASDTQLDANALPPRPTDAAGLAEWKRFVAMPNDATPHCPGTSGVTPAADAPARHGAPVSSAVAAASSTDTGNWSGYVANNKSYTDAFGVWRVPPAGGRPSTGWTYSSTWVGVGQGHSSGQPLSQAGTESDNRASGYYYLWWELYPQNSQQPIGLVVPGDSIYVHAHLSYNDDWMIAEDLTTGLGKGQTFSKAATSIWPDNTAEWIFERTEIGSTLPMLADAPPTFTGATALGTGYGGTELENLPHYAVSMWNCTSAPDKELASPGSIGSAGGFGLSWQNWGTASAYSGCSAW